MSHVLDLWVLNSSTVSIDAFKVGHSWDNNIDTYYGGHLDKAEYRRLGSITTGYNEHDYYDISVTAAKLDAKGKPISTPTETTNFYCDSSHKHNGVTIEFVLNDSGICNCIYWVNSHTENDDACNNKGNW